MRRALILTSCLASLTVRAAYAQSAPPTPVAGLEKIEHIIVLYLENRSFDNLYGLFPGAEGLAQAQTAPPQVDPDGKVYATLPPVVDTSVKPPAVDSRFPSDLPNRPFRIEQYVPLDKPTGDLVHRWYQEQEQIDGGKMDKFAAVSDAEALTMGYYDGSALPMWQIAKYYVLADHFFHARFRRLVPQSLVPHLRLLAPLRSDAPRASLVASWTRNGHMVRDGVVTPGLLCREHDPVANSRTPFDHRPGQARCRRRPRHDRRPAFGQRRELGLVFRRLGRRNRRPCRIAVPVPSPAVRLLQAIR